MEVKTVGGSNQPKPRFFRVKRFVIYELEDNMWVLLLNDMRSSNVENMTAVAKAPTKEELQAYVDAEKVEPYRSGRWEKVYREGGLLEWYNEPWRENESFVFAGSREDWAARAAENWDNQIGVLPSI